MVLTLRNRASSLIRCSSRICLTSTSFQSLNIKRFNSSESTTTTSTTNQEPTSQEPTKSSFSESIKKSEFFHKSQDCASCGIHLQIVDPESEGYYIPPTTSPESSARKKPTYRTSKNTQFLSAFSKLDDEGRALLTNQTFEDEDVIVTSKKPKDKVSELITCKRCHDALHHSQYNTESIQSLQLSEILETIPVKSSIYHVFSATDFPLSLVNLPARRGDVKFVMNKTDMLFGHGATIDKYDWYFKNVIRRLTGLKNSPVYMVSAFSNWGVKSLLSKLKDNVIYLVGYVNTGKTKLANRIENSVRFLGNEGVKSDKKLLGSSHFPALTRDTIEHRLSSRKTLVDTPGLISDDNVFKHIKPEFLKNITQGQKQIISDLRKERYHSARDGQVVSIAGGLVLLKVAKGTIIQTKSSVYGELRNFNNIEKSQDILKSQPDALNKQIMVKPEALQDLQRYVIPPFRGTVDLLIKDVGFVQIKPTGSIPSQPELFEVYAPKGVILGVRETIEHFLTGYIKEFGTKEKKHYHKGEVVKITKSEKLRLKPKSIPKYKIFSQLYHVPMDCEDVYAEMERQFYENEKYDGFMKWDRGEDRDLTRNRFWIERL